MKQWPSGFQSGLCNVLMVTLIAIASGVWLSVAAGAAELLELPLAAEPEGRLLDSSQLTSDTDHNPSAWLDELNDHERHLASRAAIAVSREALAGVLPEVAPARTHTMRTHSSRGPPQR